MVASAIVFLSVLIVFKTGVFNKKEIAVNKMPNLIGTETIKELALKDTDGDGIVDWEEGLWGTDPNNKETTKGTPDSVAINKLKAEQGINITNNTNTQTPEKLTQTEEFSREFFTTVATLNQNGQMDNATVEKLSQSLSEHIQNSEPRKVYTLAEMKIGASDSVQSVKTYDTALDSIHKKYPIKGTVPAILQKFMIDENNVDITALDELDPIILQTQNIINALVKTSVPKSFAPLHLDFINGLQRLLENTEDMKLYDTDVIVALSAISQYDQNAETLASANNNLANAIKEKLSN